jgi:hypothetical protein
MHVLLGSHTSFVYVDIIAHITSLVTEKGPGCEAEEMWSALTLD